VNAPASSAISTRSATGSRVPWVHVIALKQTSRASATASAYASRSIRPSSVSTTRTSTPSRSSRFHGRMPAGCSRSVRTTTSPGSQSMAPAIRVIPSVVLSVRAISSGSAPTKSATRSRTVSYVSKARLYGSVVAEPYSWSARNSDAASTTYSGLGPCAPKLKYAASPRAAARPRAARAGSSGRRLRVPPFRRCALRPRR